MRIGAIAAVLVTLLAQMVPLGASRPAQAAPTHPNVGSLFDIVSAIMQFSTRDPIARQGAVDVP